MTRFRLEFDSRCFRESWREVMEAYFRGETTPSFAAHALGLSRKDWERNLAGLFQVGLQTEEGVEPHASLKEVET